MSPGSATVLRPDGVAAAVAAQVSPEAGGWPVQWT